MRFEVLTMEQRSDEWRAARAGLVTGSCADCLTAKLKNGGEPAARRDYRMQLAIERLTGMALEDDAWQSKEMLRGAELEPEAFGIYEAVTGQLVRKTGFLRMTEFQAGCSLDGDVDEFTGIIELKCPKSTTHVGYLRNKVLPADYVAQVTHNLWVTGAQWCDFISYDNRMPDGLQFFCVRVQRDAVNLSAYEAELGRFLSEVRILAEQLQELRVAA